MHSSSTRDDCPHSFGNDPPLSCMLTNYVRLSVTSLGWWTEATPFDQLKQSWCHWKAQYSSFRKSMFCRYRLQIWELIWSGSDKTQKRIEYKVSKPVL